MSALIIVFAVAFIISYLFLKLFLNSFRNKLNNKLPPTLPRLPFIGSLPFLPEFKEYHTFFIEKSKTLGKVFGFYKANRFVVVLNGKDAIYEALVKHSQSFSSRNAFYLQEISNPGCAGILEHQYDDHFKKHHRISLNILKQFGFGQRSMESRIKIEVESLVQRIKEKNGQTFSPTFDLTAAVSNVICSIIFGKRWPVDDPDFHEGTDIMSSIIKASLKSSVVNFIPLLRFVYPFRKNFLVAKDLADRWYKYIDKALKKVISDDNISFYNEYIYEMEKLKMEDSSDNEISSNINDKRQLLTTMRDLFLAGTETTVTTLEWFIIAMGNHPEAQKQVREELDRVVGRERLPCLDDKPNLPITEAAILELMRFYTLLPLSVPHLTIKDTNIYGMLIPVNTLILPNLYSAHMDPDVWDEPDKFKLKRFLNEDCSNVINKNSIIPFSLGKRACLGELLARQELFLFSSALIQQFEILPPDGQDKIVFEEQITSTYSPISFEARLIKRF